MQRGQQPVLMHTGASALLFSSFAHRWSHLTSPGQLRACDFGKAVQGSAIALQSSSNCSDFCVNEISRPELQCPGLLGVLALWV